VLIFTKNKIGKWIIWLKNKTNKRNEVHFFYFFVKSAIDNTPPRLAAMQHTWEGVLFIRKRQV
jgi:hypothetical protein